MSTFESILDAAVHLPVEDRVRLVEAIVATVPDHYPATLSPEWRNEINRRWAEYKSGQTEATDWEIVHQRVFRRGNAENAR